MIIHTRWKMYADYLDTHGDYAQVFISDTRDVIFQGDLFAPFNGCTNWLGYTTEATHIGGQFPVNYNWLIGAFGRTEADKLVDKKIICVGTVIGSTDAMKTFCRTMWDALKDNNVWGHEQAAMNYFVWNNLLPIENLFEIDVQSGEIFTAAQFHRLYPVKILGDKILRGDGGIPAVVHQYDRHRELVELVDRLYRDKNFTADEKFSDVRSVLEQVNHLVFIGKIDDAARLCMNTLPGKANFDGNVDRLLKIWERVLNAPLTPAVGYLELSIQNVLLTAKVFSLPQLNKIFSYLVQSVKTRRVVFPQFKFVVLESLYTILEQSINANAAAQCFQLIDLIKALDVPPNKKFLLLQAKANRIFGRKEQALAAYKAALELN